MLYGIHDSHGKGEGGGLAERVGAQAGPVSLDQLRALGYQRGWVEHRVRTGWLRRRYRGVYVVGEQALSTRGERFAAMLAGGPDAALSHAAAAACEGLAPEPWRYHVTVPRPRRMRGIIWHCSELHEQDVIDDDGLRYTSVARTALDLCALWPRRRIERLCDEAERLRVFDLADFEAVIARAHGRHEAPILRAILDEHVVGSTLTRSEIEERMLVLLRGAGLPAPKVNQPLLVDGHYFEPDFLWPEHRLIVETDGRGAHDTRKGFESDRRRDAILTLAGFRVVRFTWRQVVSEPRWVAQTIARLLATPGRRAA